MFLQCLMILGCFVSFSTAQTIPVTASELTTSNSRFNYTVTTIIAHPDDPKHLVISDWYSVWVFNPTTGVKTLIAGSSGSGYVEGSGSSARFYAISGSSHLNKSTVLFVEHGNHCVRSVNLISKFTERYAGVCRTSGQTDGARLSAQFYSPWGISQVDSTFFISEWMNNSIRRVQNDIVSTITSTPSIPSGLAWNGVDLFFIFQHGVGKINIQSNQQTLLTGVKRSSGYTNGNMNSARFNHPKHIVALAEKTFLVSDRDNNALRLVDLTKQLVSSLTINEFGSSKPEGISIYDGEVLVGLHDGRVLRFPIDSLPVSLSVVSCNADATLTIPDDGFSVLFIPNTINTTWINCIVCPTKQNLTVGIYKFAYKYQSVAGWIYKFCNQTVTVIADTPEVTCPLNQNFTIPVGQTSQYFTLPKINMGNPRLRCVSCSLSGKVLYEGVYTEKIVYIDVLTNQSLECSYQINVQRLTPPCFNDTVRIYLEKNETKSRDVKIEGLAAKLRIDPGVLEVEMDNGCFKIYEVYEWSEMTRRVQLQASYKMKCDSLNQISFLGIDASLRQSTKLLQALCPECKIAGKVDIQCINDTVTVIWKTDITSAQQWLDENEKERTALEDSLKKYQRKFPEIDITALIGLVPRTISPVKDASGFYIQVVTKSKCMDTNFIYNIAADVCVRTKCD